MLFRNLLCAGFFLCFASLIHAQVGINTTDPRTSLEVAGDTHVDGEVHIQTIEEITLEEEVIFLVQDQNNFVKEINASGDGVAIAYFQEYRLSNMESGTGDWVENFNTNIPSSDYMLTVISAYYNQALKIKDVNENFTIPFISAFIDSGDGTWRIVADYPSADNVNTTEVGEWIINTLILSKSFSKIFPTQEFGLNNSTSGSATQSVFDQ